MLEVSLARRLPTFRQFPGVFELHATLRIQGRGLGRSMFGWERSVSCNVMQVLSTFVLIAVPSWGAATNNNLTQALQWASTDCNFAVLLPTYQTTRSHNTKLYNVKPHQSGFITQKEGNFLLPNLNLMKNIHRIQIDHQLDATISQFIILTFIYSSTCFGRPHAHHQELQQLQ